MHTNLKQLLILINKITEVETLFNQQGIELISLPPDLLIDGEIDDQPIADLPDDTNESETDEEAGLLSVLSFDREAVRGWTRIKLSVQIVTYGTKNLDTTVHGYLKLKTTLDETYGEMTLLRLNFEIDDHDQIVARLEKNELDLKPPQDEEKILSALKEFFSKGDLNPQEMTDLIAKIVEYFKLQPETGKIAQA